MDEVSTLRLHVMRACYAFAFVGLALTVWPSIVTHKLDTPLSDGVVDALLSAVGVLAAVGIRYPLKMLPLMFFEIIWKGIWLLAFALPLYRAGKVDADTSQTIFACSLVIIFPIAIPWGYAYAKYIKEPGDRWWRSR